MNVEEIGKKIIDMCIDIIKDRDIVVEDSDETPSLEIVHNIFNMVLHLQTQKDGIIEIEIRDLNDYI